jgi:hypothetical protein
VPDKATGVPHWVFLDRKQPHSHDVRSLTALLRPDSDPLLLSGGNDGQVVLYSLERFLKEHPTRQSKSPQRPLLQLACEGHPARLLHAQQRTLSVWELGRAVRSQALLGGEAAGEDDLRHAYACLTVIQTRCCNSMLVIAVLWHYQLPACGCAVLLPAVSLQAVLGT